MTAILAAIEGCFFNELILGPMAVGVGLMVLDLGGGLIDLRCIGYVLCSGELSWPPSGTGVETFGRLMGPNGDTPSCNVNQEARVGALGGFAGSHFTVVVFTTESLSSFSPLAVFCTDEAASEMKVLLGPSRVLAREPASVVELSFRPGNLGSSGYSSDFWSRERLRTSFL